MLWNISLKCHHKHCTYIKIFGLYRVKKQPNSSRPSFTQKRAAEVPDESIKTEKKNKNRRKRHRQEVD
jgi:hypothetical protein